MPASVAVRHNFESGHRLPHLGGHCTNLHGHSWWTEVTVEAPELKDGLLVEFGAFKKVLRGWIDDRLDHGVLLGPDDELGPLLRDHGQKVYTMPDWPTVEHVAAHIADIASVLLIDIPHAPGACISAVHVQETHVNAAQWSHP